MFSRRRFLQISAASTGLAITGTDLLSQAVANASASIRADGSRGIRHIVILMMENRSFDHFLGWLPGADGRHDLTYVSAVDGNTYPNYPLAPDFQGCGYSDPDHSWEGWLVQYNYGAMDGFLQRPTTPADNPGVTLAAANTFPVGYYTNLNPDRSRKALPDVPVIGALAESYTALDRYFCAFAGETYPNRFYQHAGQTDRDHNSFVPSTLPTIWDQLSPIPNSAGIPTGGYYYQDAPFLALWADPAIEPGATFKYQAFMHPFSDADAATAALSSGTSFVTACQNGTLPNVCYIDPAFYNETTGTSGDDHPQGDIRLGERFIADAYHALADNGHLDDTVFVVTFDEWGGFYDHVPPPQVIDDTNPADVMHAGDSSTPTDGRLYPNYSQLGFRVPGIVVSNLAWPHRVVHDGPFEHCSSLALIESTFGLTPLTARDRYARNLQEVLLPYPVAGRWAVQPSAIPTSSDVIGPAISPPSESLLQVLEGTASYDPADICSADSVQSVSPAPVNDPALPQTFGGIPGLHGTSGMDDLFGNYFRNDGHQAP
ncbi:MAG TPA: alkaline phosphatase family protein [Streptosporangiaceae bacterium]|nr:alkaline phosphatase family protein [Streptosporangiaceae bacterium]